MTNAYDEMPYPSTTFPQAHPNRLAAMGRLFGLTAPSPATARVLELGCSDGGNIIPMAAMAPAARFLGIDLSALQVAAGQKTIAALGLGNVSVRQENIMDFPDDAGPFDYIIAHGVYSWVPAPVRERVLQIIARQLTPHGIAFVSFNALPGAHLRQALRELVFFNTSGITEIKQKVAAGRALFESLAAAVAEDTASHAALMREEFARAASVPDFYFAHEYLEEENGAFYFHEFASAAARHRLQYLGEPSLSQMLPHNLGRKAGEMIARLPTVVAQEQAMDYLRNRAFRQSLLCHSDAPVKRSVTSDLLSKFAFSPYFSPPPAGASLVEGEAVTFTGKGEARFTVARAFTKGVLALLATMPGRASSYSYLVDAARAAAGGGSASGIDGGPAEGALLNDLMFLYSSSFVELHAEGDKRSLVPPDRPRLTPLARYQTAQGLRLTNGLHESIPVDDLARHTFSLCDGVRTLDDIARALWGRVRAGALVIQENNQPIVDEGRALFVLQRQVGLIVQEGWQHGVLT